MTGQHDGCASRRAVLGLTCAAGVGGLLGGCQAYDQSGGGESANPPSAPEAGGAVAALARTADIPVGGGKIFAGQKVVVTQPAAGEFKAFSAVCTHAGCTVATVSGGTINCECHGSKYKIADGSVAGGPAPKPLPARGVTVDGDSLRLT